MFKTILSVLVIAFLVSCANPKLEFEKSTGKYNIVKSGKQFSVFLPEDHNTRYYWALKDTYSRYCIQYLGSQFHGQDAKQVEFIFVAAGSGKTELGFHLYSYQDTAQVKYFLVEVE